MHAHHTPPTPRLDSGEADALEEVLDVMRHHLGPHGLEPGSRWRETFAAASTALDIALATGAPDRPTLRAAEG